MTTEELCAEIEELDKVLAEKSYPRLIEELRTLAIEAAKKLREMQRRDEVLGKLIANPDWHRQMAGSIEFFENGGVGKTLADLGLE